MTIAMTLLAPIDPAADASPRSGFVPCEAEDDVARHLLRPHFSSDRETLILAGFDAFDRLVRLERAGSDSASRCIIPSRCWRRLFGSGVVAIIMAHNHPSGDARPSTADTRTTQDTALFLRTMEVELIDHLIFVASGHFSFRSAELL